MKSLLCYEVEISLPVLGKQGSLRGKFEFDHHQLFCTAPSGPSLALPTLTDVGLEALALEMSYGSCVI